MKELSEKGEYTLTADELALLTEKFSAGCCDDDETLETIGKVYREYGYLMDTHTAVAWNVAEKAEKSGNKTVVLSTASPYKFSASVLKALGESTDGSEFEMLERLHALTGVAIPASLASLEEAETLHKNKIDKEAMQSYALACAKEEI